MLPRDIFINEIYDSVASGSDIYFLCADLGAKALDKFRSDYPDRFIHTMVSRFLFTPWALM
jgi:transketolase